MIRTTHIGVVSVLAIASLGIAVAGEHSDFGDHDSNVWSKHTRMATVAIPCAPADVGLRFSCSNKSSRGPLEVVDVKCIIGAGDTPEVQRLFEFVSEVAPETTVVEVVSCPDIPVPTFCTARVFPRQNARCALTSPAGGLNAELK